MDEDELFNWLEDVYASNNNALPTIDLTEYNVTLRNGEVVNIERNDSESGTNDNTSTNTTNR